MTLQEQRERLDEKKKQINEILKNHPDDIIRELTSIVQEKNINIFQAWDRQIALMVKVCGIAFAEERCHDKKNILDNIHSLDELEMLYTEIKFLCLRIENDMPDSALEDSIEYIRQCNIGGIALHQIIVRETWKRESNIIAMARLLKQYEMIDRAIILLHLASETYSKNNNICMELADCWMSQGRWKEAYDVLKKIKRPKKDIQEILTELEKVVVHENI